MWRKDSGVVSTGRNRAFSVATNFLLSGFDEKPILHASSDTELDKIDKNRSFATTNDFRQTTGLLAKVVSALATVKTPPSDNIQPGMEDMFGGVHGFSDSQILNNELPHGRIRARSDFNLPQTWLEPKQSNEHNEWTWSGDNQKIQEAINNRHNRKTDSFIITIEDRENFKPRTKKFSMPDGLRKLFGNRKNSSKELFANIRPNTENDRKFSVVSVPETKAQIQGQSNPLYNTVTAGEQMKLPEHDIRYQVPPISGLYKKFLNTAVLGSTSNISKKRQDSQNPTPSSRRSSMLTSSSGSCIQNKVLQTRKGSLFPLPTEDRRPSLFSVASEKERDVLENTTLADLIRALEVVHTKDVLEEQKKDFSKNDSLIELGGIFGISDDKKSKKFIKKDKLKDQLAMRRSTVVGLQSTRNTVSIANDCPLRRRRNAAPQTLPDLNRDLPPKNQTPTFENNAQPSHRFQRRFSVRPTAMQIAPGKAPAVIKTDLSAPLAIASAVQHRRAMQRPSPLAQERRNLSSSDSLLPARTATSSSTFSPLSRIVRLTQAAQRKNSIPDQLSSSTNSKNIDLTS